MKGTINENIIEALNLRPLDEVLKEQGIDVCEEEPQAEDCQPIDELVTLQAIKTKLQMIEGTDHGESMDDLHQEVLQHARDLMTYGFNLDHPRARGIFEIATVLYGHALTAKNSKRDAQLKTMKLALDRRRVDLEEKRTNHIIGQIDATPVVSDDGIMVADRNDLLRRIRSGEL